MKNCTCFAPGTDGYVFSSWVSAPKSLEAWNGKWGLPKVVSFLSMFFSPPSVHSIPLCLSCRVWICIIDERFYTMQALQELSRKYRCQTHQRIHLQISFSALVGSSVCSIFHYPWVLCCQTKEKWSTHWSVPSFHVLDEGKRTLQADFPPRTFKSNIRIQVIVLLVLLVLGDVSCFERKLT